MYIVIPMYAYIYMRIHIYNVYIPMYVYIYIYISKFAPYTEIPMGLMGGLSQGRGAHQRASCATVPLQSRRRPNSHEAVRLIAASATASSTQSQDVEAELLQFSLIPTPPGLVPGAPALVCRAPKHPCAKHAKSARRISCRVAIAQTI